MQANLGLKDDKEVQQEKQDFITINGVKYWTSSVYLSKQSLAPKIQDLYYVIFYMTPAVFETEIRNELDGKMAYDLLYLTIQIFICTVILFLIIWCITLNFAKKITNPIIILTQYTNDLKLAQNMNEKRLVIEKIKKDPLFK